MDQSTNSVQSSEVFNKVEAALRDERIEEAVRAQLLSLLAEMKANQGTGNYTALYQRFMAAAADHMTVLAPFLPALASLLPS